MRNLPNDNFGIDHRLCKSATTQLTKRNHSLAKAPTTQTLERRPQLLAKTLYYSTITEMSKEFIKIFGFH